ncbi:MAG: oligosaccharide flippase family protein [Candidatus Omnitrophica bacterium]|nr:oligosaccharide flippase family protein [Candidatus Omnitrophota bacterium]
MENKNIISGVNFAEFTLKTFSVLFFSQFAYLAVSIIAARILGPSGKGVLAVITLYPILLFTFCNLSVYRALTVAVAEKKYKLADFCGSSFAYIFFSSFIMTAGFFVFYFNFPGFFIKEASLPLVALSLGILPALLAINLFTSILEVNAKINWINLKHILHSLVLLVSIAVTLLLLKMVIKGALLSYFIANTFSACLLFYFTKKICPQKWGFNWQLLKKLLKDGAKLHIAVIANFIALRIDILMLGYYRQSSSVGFYSIAVAMTELLFLVTMATQTVFFSKAAQLVKDKQDMAKKTMLIYRHSLVIYVGAAGALAFLAKTIIILFYGKAFLDSVMPLLILLPGVVILYTGNGLVNYLTMMKKYLQLSFIFVLGSILNIGLNSLLIPRFDSSGAAIASTITYWCNSFLVWGLFLSVSGYKPGEFFRGLIFEESDLSMYKQLLKKISMVWKR